MKRTAILGALMTVGVLFIVVAAAQTPSASLLQVDKIQDNLFVLKGGGGNTAAYLTTKGVVLVDTKLPGWGRPLVEKLREITDKPVTTVINTHTHFDHVSGNVELPATVEVVVHEHTAQLMREMRPLPVANTPKENIFTQHGGRGLPTRTFTDRLTLGSGNDRIDLYYFGRSHTKGDAFVVFPAARAMHTGDAFPNKGIPIIDPVNEGSGIDYADTISKAAALPNIDTVITGHHSTTLSMADVVMYADFNREFVDAVRTAKATGRTIGDVASTWKVPQKFLDAGYTQPPPGTSGQGTARLRANIEIIWGELN